MIAGILFDENLSPAYRTQLLRRNPSLAVRAVGGPNAPPMTTADPELLIWCEERNFVLVTNNRRSMPKHLADHLARGRHVPGIIVLDPDWPMAQILDSLELVAGALLEDEYRDQVVYLPRT